ncbi:MAG: glycosyltransferase family 2 protein [Aquificae bacterium]|nr:glycosyltransferase family 2 protein [Aquificota bacterium]
MEKVRLSVAIVAKDEEDRLPRTLEAVSDLADEVVVVVDASSSDRTAEVAARLGARVFIEEWKGYAGQKNSALEKCRGEWVLFLDADEVPDEGLKEEVRRVLEEPTAEGYLLRRKAVYAGKPLRFVWGKEYLLRLVRRSANPRWAGKVHERLLLDGRVEKLKRGWLYHYTYRSVSEHFQKSLLYAELSALERFERGRRPSFWRLVLGPPWAFFKTYLLKGGVLEGWRGLAIAASYAFNALIKELRLRELSLDQNTKEDVRDFRGLQR